MCSSRRVIAESMIVIAAIWQSLVCHGYVPYIPRALLIQKCMSRAELKFPEKTLSACTCPYLDPACETCPSRPWLVGATGVADGPATGVPFGTSSDSATASVAEGEVNGKLCDFHARVNASDGLPTPTTLSPWFPRFHVAFLVKSCSRSFPSRSVTVRYAESDLSNLQMDE